MAKKPRPAQSPTNGRESDESLRLRGFSPFLRPDHVIEGEELFLTGFNYRHRDGTQICVTVSKPDGSEYVLGIREGSPDHSKFFKAFGAAFADWAPGSVTVTIGKGNRPGADVSFVNVREVTAR